jgi:thioredoxin reductase (NADPH)
MNKVDRALRLFGRRGSADAYAIRDFLHRSGVPFEWIDLTSTDLTSNDLSSNDLNSYDLTSNEQARREAHVSGPADERLPICVFPDGTRMEHVTIRQITEKLGWFLHPSRAEYDLSIYGAGPAGLSAAVYGASEGLKTVLVERFALGGRAGTSPKIENYLGFPQGINGAELTDRAREQAVRFGAEILLLREGVRGEFLPGKGIVQLADGTKIISRASICATGMDYRRLDLPNEEKLRGAGVYYGAGSSEASLCRSESVIVVGGGNSGAQAAVHFARYASDVYLVIRDDSLKHTVSEYLIDRIRSTPKINVLTRMEVVALQGESQLRAVTLRNNETGGEMVVETSWLFLCLGGMPHTDWAVEVGIIRDEAGYLMTGPDLQKNGKRPENWQLDRDPYYLETNIPGVFAAGDVRHGSVKRCASAVGEGAMAVTFVHRYVTSG